MNKIESDFVKPFYLKMMGMNSVRTTDDLWNGLTAAGSAVTVSDVRWMLRTGLWRPVVMGAWFSVAVPAEQIKNDLVAALSQSQGSLTAPPLAAAATVVAGTAAVPAMTTYLDFVVTPTRRDGSEDVVAAAMEYLGADSPVAPSDKGRQAFHALRDTVIRLQDALRAP